MALSTSTEFEVRPGDGAGTTAWSKTKTGQIINSRQPTSSKRRVKRFKRWGIVGMPGAVCDAHSQREAWRILKQATPRIVREQVVQISRHKEEAA